MLRVLSLGAGVQSSTLALMIAKGQVPMVDCAIFSDTQWEPKAVYTWLDWLEKQLPYPVHRVTAGNLRANVVQSKNAAGGRFATIPWHIVNPDGTFGIGRRQCTREYKLDPLRKKKRELLGFKAKQRIPLGSCETLIGISLDEALRMKPSTDRWDKSTWPLVELKMTRNDCLGWMQRHDYPEPAKSSCIGCPYHSKREWQAIKADPVSWADALEIDQIIREPILGQRGQQFMHSTRKPLAEVNLDTAQDRGQSDMFINECEGMCGV